MIDYILFILCLILLGLFILISISLKNIMYKVNGEADRLNRTKKEIMLIFGKFRDVEKDIQKIYDKIKKTNDLKKKKRGGGNK